MALAAVAVLVVVGIVWWMIHRTGMPVASGASSASSVPTPALPVGLPAVTPSVQPVASAPPPAQAPVVVTAAQPAELSASATLPVPLKDRPVVSKPVPRPRPVSQPASRIEPLPRPTDVPPATAPALVYSQSPPLSLPPAPLPVPAPSPSPRSPSEACGKRVFIALALCMNKQCQTSDFAQHPQCVQMRDEEQQRENSRNSVHR